MKKTNLIFWIFLSFLLIPPFASSDGILISYEYEDLYEPSQTALIVFDNNQEDIYLKVSYEGDATKFSWIIPTPALPDVTEAPENLFVELHEITKPIIKSDYFLDKSLYVHDALQDGVTVHSEKKVGIFNVAILSAEGSNGLYDWLESNDYTVPSEAKTLFDWYIEKGWYFTAMKIYPGEDKTRQLQQYLAVKYIKNATQLTDYREDIAAEITEQIVQEFPNYDRTQDLVENDNRLRVAIQKSFLELQGEFPDFFTDRNIQVISDEVLSFFGKGRPDFPYICWVPTRQYDSSIPREFRFCLYGELESNIGYQLREFNLKQKSKLKEKLGITPIKLSFQSDEIIYPLKISQFSTKESCDNLKTLERRYPNLNSEEVTNKCKKTNEILLYVLAHNKVQAPKFGMEYARWIDPDKLIEEENNMDHYIISNLSGIKNIIDKKYFLTKLKRSFAKEEMDDDLYIVQAKDNQEYQLESSGYYLTEEDNTIKPLSVSYKENDYEIYEGKKIIQKERVFYSLLDFIINCLWIFILGLACIASFLVYKKYKK